MFKRSLVPDRLEKLTRKFNKYSAAIELDVFTIFFSVLRIIFTNCNKPELISFLNLTIFFLSFFAPYTSIDVYISNPCNKSFETRIWSSMFPSPRPAFLAASTTHVSNCSLKIENDILPIPAPEFPVAST